MIKVYVDAAFANGNAGVGVVLYYDGKQQIYSRYITNVIDNHHAEFQAMIIALDYLIDNGLHHHTIQLFTDSIIVAKAVERQSVKNDWQKPYLEELLIRLNLFALYFVEWFNDKMNAFPDKVAKRALLSGRDIV